MWAFSCLAHWLTCYHNVGSHEISGSSKDWSDTEHNRGGLQSQDTLFLDCRRALWVNLPVFDRGPMLWWENLTNVKSCDNQPSIHQSFLHAEIGDQVYE